MGQNLTFSSRQSSLFQLMTHREDMWSESQKPRHGKWMKWRASKTVYAAVVRVGGKTAGATMDLKGLCLKGWLAEALDIMKVMGQKGTVPSPENYENLMNCCARLRALDAAKFVHAHMVEHGLIADSYLVNAAITMFVKCGSLSDAVMAFDCAAHRDIFAWTAIILGYVNAGQSREALNLYHVLQKQKLPPNRNTYLGVLKACSSLADLEEGKSVHADIIRSAWHSDLFVNTTVVDMYVKCGSMSDAQDVFVTMSERNEVAWYTMIAGYASQDQGRVVLQMYSQMREEGLCPHDRILVSVLKGCGSLATIEPATSIHGQSLKVSSLVRGKIIHSEALKWGYDSDVYVATTLVDMYAKCGSVVDAQVVFEAMSQMNVASWNAMIAGYSNEGLPEKALELYVQMRHKGVSPNHRTLVSALQACGNLAAKEEDTIANGQLARVKALSKGRCIHAEISRKGLLSNVFASNTIVHMYAKCGNLMDAQNVFDLLVVRDAISWNVIISGYAQQATNDVAFQLYCQMQEEGVKPDKWTFVSVLQACAGLAVHEEVVIRIEGQSVKQDLLWKGKTIHGEILKRGLESDLYISTALVDMYGKCGSPLDAQHVFDKLSYREVVTWNALVAGYATEDHADTAFRVYAQMQQQGTKPDESTFLSLLKASSAIGALSKCSHIHSDILKFGLQSSISVTNTLIHAYGKCGSIVQARRVFDSFPKRDIVSWNAMMAAYARQGEYVMSLECFQEMQQAGVTPDEHTYLSVLASCSHAGMVQKGLGYFTSMCRDYGITPTPFHWASVVDLLGRAGLLTEAEDLILRMPVQPITMWLSLLGACRTYNNVELGRRAFEGAIKLDPKRSSAYVLMANLYSRANMWDDAYRISDMRTDACAWKKPGQSWVEDGKDVHLFLVEDRKHCQIELIREVLVELTSQIKEQLPTNNHGGEVISRCSVLL